MEIIPYIGEQRAFGPGELSVQVADAKDLERLQDAYRRATQIKTVFDSASLGVAKRTLAELRGLEEEIATSKKWIKSPIQQILNAIEQYAKEIAEPITQQKERIAGLANAHLKRLEAARAEEERKRQEEINRTIREAEAAKEKALAEAKEARDLADRAKKELAAAQAQLSAELAGEIAEIRNPAPAPVKVPGGRVDHDHEFKLINVKELVASPDGWELLRYEIDKLACKDRVRLLIEKGLPVQIPGIQITPTTKLHMRPGARIK